MKKLLIILLPVLIAACSTTEPVEITSQDIEKANASIDWGPPADINGYAALGVGVKRLPQDVLDREITVSPPGEGRIYTYIATFTYPSILRSLPPLPSRQMPKRDRTG